jgi:ParB family transcriptional regulator, chromosome partitioning protein
VSQSERLIRIDSIRIPTTRDPGSCLKLAHSIRDQGLLQPITIWSDGTLISGRRRLTACILLGKNRIPGVFVDTIEDAAKRLHSDGQYVQPASAATPDLSLPWKWSEVVRLWDVLRSLDAPAAVKRADEARRRGAELRRQTQAGKRPPGRSVNHSEDYVLCVMCEPFGVSAATAKRIEVIHRAATGRSEVYADKRELAVEVLADLDETGNVWGNYQRLTGARMTSTRRAPAPPGAAMPAARQAAAWAKAVPQLEGLAAGLAELGPPNPEFTWEQVGPVHARLAAVRRELEKIIKQMRETHKS